jgi:hypothetical protein
MEKVTETTMIENTTSHTGVDEERREAAAKGKLDEINRDMAKRGTATEHKMGSWEALKVYRRGAFWSMFISLSIIMRAYDIKIMATSTPFRLFNSILVFSTRGTAIRSPPHG